MRLLADVDAGVVDEDVEAAELGHRVSTILRHCASSTTSTVTHGRLDAELGQFRRRRFALGRVAAGDGDGRARTGKAARHAKPDAAIAAGDEGDAAREIEEVHRVLRYPTVLCCSKPKG